MKIKKIGILLLTISLLATSLTGCLGGVESDIPNIIPDKQIFADKYKLNGDITDNMRFKIDYMTTPGSYYGNNVEIVNLFDFTKVQIDEFKSFEIGNTTIGDFLKIVDDANEYYIKSNTEKIINERKAIVQKEYDEAVEAAKKRGKTYDKPMKEIRTDDIQFDPPYSYKVAWDEFDEYVEEDLKDYEPTRLLDPKRVRAITILVNKYGIPYVTIRAYSRTGLDINSEITQESDWVLNQIEAANVTHCITPDPEVEDEFITPDFVDVDGRNKAAKRNIYMSGNIQFGGEGFTWESLRLLCESLQLVKSSSYFSSSTTGYVESSDQQFTYYTMYMPVNQVPEEYQYAEGEDEEREDLEMPVTRLVATFDPLTQVCINWTVDTVSITNGVYGNVIHDMSNTINVNVHKFQTDTNNYAGMRKEINEWIFDHALNTTTSYCALDGNTKKMFGKVDSGITNLFIDPTINGEKYICIKQIENNGKLIGEFISNEKYLEADQQGEDRNAFINKNKHTLEIVCGIFNENNEMIGFLNEDSFVLDGNESEIEYWIAYYEETEGGYENVKVIDKEKIGNLVMKYTQVYQLTEEKHNELYEIASQNGPIKLRKHVDAMFKDAEEAQKDQNPEMFDDDLVLDSVIKDQRAYILRDTKIYDQITTEAKEIGALNEGQFVLLKFTIGDWSYVSMEEIAGFVPNYFIKTLTKEQYETCLNGLPMDDAELGLGDFPQWPDIEVNTEDTEQPTEPQETNPPETNPPETVPQETESSSEETVVTEPDPTNASQETETNEEGTE